MDRVKIGSLPAELTSFVGRRQEVRDVKGLLTDSRLVTLTGVGGTGKTRLALRVATELRRAFPDGVWFVDLTQPHGSDLLTTEVQDPDMLADLVGTTLGIREQSTQPPLRLLAEQLAARQLLLVMDNCEQLIPACAILADALLRSCPDLRILATSRELLCIAGELIYPVPPLPAPDERHRRALTGLDQYESVALFVARAQAVRAGFLLTEQNHLAVADICRRLDGLPLAVELAAAHLRVLAPQQILDRLTNRFALLSRGRRDAPQRQQTLRACVEWSFDLCSKPERRLWARLSVFNGGFQLDAVEAICADEVLPEADVLDLVAGLVDKSILICDDHGRRVRYRMLETIREYGQEELVLRGEEAVLRRRHADWHLHRAGVAEREWFGPRQEEWCQWLRVEHRNLRVAFDFYLTAQDSRQQALHLAGTLWFYWLVFGLVREGRDWSRRALEVNPEGTRDRAAALWGDGHLASVQGDLEAADRLLAEARDLAGELGDEVTQARALKRLGAVAMHRGDLEQADGLLADALARLEILREDVSIVHARIALAMNHYLRGDLTAAAQQSERTLAICRQRGDRYLAAHALNVLARVEFAHGRLKSAVTYAQEAVELRRTLPEALTLIFSLDLLAEITTAAGDYERAATLVGAARNSWQPFATSVRRWKIMAEPRQQWETRTRQALGEAAFVAAVRRGAEFTVDDIISYALGKEIEQAPGADPDKPEVLLLTRRERQIAELVAQGMSNKQIAAKLVISQRTAEGHVERILRKLGLTSRTQLASWFYSR